MTRAESYATFHITLSQAKRYVARTPNAAKAQTHPLALGQPGRCSRRLHRLGPVGRGGRSSVAWTPMYPRGCNGGC